MFPFDDVIMVSWAIVVVKVVDFIVDDLVVQGAMSSAGMILT